MIVAVGLEIVDVVEFRNRWNDGSAAGVFLRDEVEYCASRARPWESYAARLAAKRAFLLALDNSGLGCRAEAGEVEVVRLEGGDVELRLHGGAREALAAAGVDRCHVSVAHTRATATGLVVLERT